MKIVLMRHGKPEFDLHALTQEKFNATELTKLLKYYENCSLNKDQKPHEAAVNIAKQCSAMVCSDLVRSIQSAELLGKNSPIIDSLFRELPAPIITLPWPRLKMIYWIYFFFIVWLLGYHKGSESFWQIKGRAEQASNKLIKVAEDNEAVLFVGHGVINRFIGKSLVKKGWKRIGKRKESYWDFVIYEKN